jgi:tRNA threonylcarbamoyladenosine biosynthesis protein TsaB
MTTLVLDTSLHCAQAALFDGETCLVNLARKGERGQAEILLPLLEDLLDEARLAWKNLTEVIVTVGPGVFTGIRIGISVARALKLALNIPVVGVSTLHILAAQAIQKDKDKDKAILSLIDAHKNEIYAQRFSSALVPQAAPVLLKGAELASQLYKAGQIVAYPLALVKERAELKNAYGVAQLDLAKALKCALLAPHQAAPLYVRAPDALAQRKGLAKDLAKDAQRFSSCFL